MPGEVDLPATGNRSSWLTKKTFQVKNIESENTEYKCGMLTRKLAPVPDVRPELKKIYQNDL
jgi:hypothetical protein